MCKAGENQSEIKTDSLSTVRFLFQSMVGLLDDNPFDAGTLASSETDHVDTG